MSVAVVAALVGPMSVTPALAAHTTQVLRAPVGVPNPVPSSGAVQCSVEAVDSEQREMKYKWECDAGTFDDATLATPIWTAPANETPQPAQYTIKVAITTAPRGLETILGAPVATGEFVVTVQPQQAQVPPVDLQINSEWLVLSLETPNPFMLIEPIADRQCIACAFVNRTARDAPNVHVRFSAGPAAGPLQPIGNPVAVGLVEAGGSATATVLWNLQGANIENYRISAEVYIPDQQDINPADNTASITASIYYAYKNRAFSWPEDSYAFPDYVMDDDEIAGMTESTLGVIVGSMGLQTNVGALVEELLFTPTLLRLTDYFDGSAAVGMGDHSRGMAASVALYYVDGSLKPVRKPTGLITQEEAAANIAVYGEAQALGLFEAVFKGEAYMNSDLTPAQAAADLRTYLRDRRECALLEVYGPEWGQGLAAYKLIEVEGRNSVVYVYDADAPPNDDLRARRVMPQIVLGEGSVSAGEQSAYDQVGARWAGVQKIRRNIPAAEAKAFVPLLKRVLYQLAGDMARRGKIMVTVACPADAVMVDKRGRRVGVVNDQPVNELPQAEVLRTGLVEIYLLPANEQFWLQLRGTGNGETRVSVMRAEAPTIMHVTAFTGIATKWGTAMSTVIKDDATVDNLLVDGVPTSPTVKGFVAAANTDIWSVDPNRPPTRPVVTISPAAPAGGDSLYCIASGSIDPDGDEVTYRYQWYRNDEALEGRIYAGLAAMYVKDGHVWRCVVTPTDGEADGPSGEATVTVKGQGTAADHPPVDPGTDDWQFIASQQGGYSIRIPQDWRDDTGDSPDSFYQRFRKNHTQRVAVQIAYERTGPMNQAQLQQHAQIGETSFPMGEKQSERWLNVPGGLGLEMVFAGTAQNVPVKGVVHYLSFGDDCYSILGVTDQGTANVNFPVLQRILGTFTRVGPATIVPVAAHNFAITAPTAGQTVGKTLTVTGTAQPGSKVRVTINYWFRVLVASWAKLSQTEVTADAGGVWEVRDANLDISIFGRSSRYEVVAELLGPDGVVVSTEKVEVKRN
jgi:hypothetical protein